MPVIGAFIFRNEGDGCLTSKYFNNTLPTPLMECAKFQRSIGVSPLVKPDDRFCGIYKTVWLEDVGKAIEAELRISKRTADIYKVEWLQSKALKYSGEGMIVGELLIGWYQDI